MSRGVSQVVGRAIYHKDETTKPLICFNRKRIGNEQNKGVRRLVKGAICLDS